MKIQETDNAKAYAKNVERTSNGYQKDTTKKVTTEEKSWK
jgi:hypothetical protein